MSPPRSPAHSQRRMRWGLCIATSSLRTSWCGAIVKVLDFGLAKLIEQTPLDAEAETRMQVQTQAGMIAGTVRYMSPEQARGQQVDARTDVFSTGVVMYEMLAGQSPFAGDTTSDVIAAILTTEPKPPSSFNQEIPAEL